MEYNENWDRIRSILYDENGIPRKKILKENYKKLSYLVKTINEEFVRAYLGNDRDFMEKLVETGLFNLDFFTATLTPEKRAYFELGQLSGQISLMGRILSTMVARDRSLHRFKELQKSSRYAKDIILCIGSSYSIEEKEVIKKVKKGDLENAITNLILWGFVYEQNYGEDHILYLSDLGRLVYYHYTSNKEEEIFYRH